MIGSRFRGNWNFCSDFDFAIKTSLTESIELSKNLSNKFGVKIDIIGSDVFDNGVRNGLKINKNELL